MQALPEALARIEALRQALVEFDPPASTMLAEHMAWLHENDRVLVECSIGLSMPTLAMPAVTFGEPAMGSKPLQHADPHAALRDRIDVLRGVVPRPNPISQTDGS